MHEIKDQQDARIGWIYAVAGFVSILLSVWSGLKESVINNDAICYIQSAATMETGLHEAMHLCGQAQWPFYSILIYGLSKLLHSSTLISAYVLDGLFSLITVLMFIHVIRFFKPNLKIMWLAAAVILLAHEFNSIRVYIIRDHGFWAFYLISIWLSLSYFRRSRLKTACAWSLSLLVAMLFRIEGLLFLILVPFVAWVYPDKKIGRRCKDFFQLQTVMIVLVSIIVLINLLQSGHELGRVNEVKFQLLNGCQAIIENFNAKASALGTHVLSVFSQGDAKIIMGLMLLSWYLYSVVTNLSVIYFLLVIYAWSKKLLTQPVLWAYLIINVIITSMFLAENTFISKRYLVALSLTLMIWVPFALENLFAQKNKRLSVFIIIFIIVTSLGGIFTFGYSKEYIREAGDWLEKNVPSAAKLYSNDYQVMFYSQHFGNDIFTKAPAYIQADAIANGKWNQYDYLALRSGRGSEDVALPFSPIQVFKNKRGDQVSIYKVTH